MMCAIRTISDVLIMAKPAPLLIESENPYYYYKLKPHYSKFITLITKMLIFPFSAPRRLVSLLFGRLLALFIFNPLLTKNESETNELIQNKKYPDPDFTNADDYIVVNVINESNFFIKALRNYYYRLTNQLSKIPLTSYITSDDPALENIANPRTIHEVMGKVSALVNGQPLPDQVKDTRRYKPEQIVLKGLEHLDENYRKILLDNLKKTHGHDFETNRSAYSFFTLEARDGAVLDSVEVRGTSENEKPIEDRTFIISCMPRSNNYMFWLKKFRYYAKEIDTTIVSFNYRGVGRSKGLVWTQNDMINDAIAQAERLIALGAKPENIAFEGECVGANVATCAAAKMHQRNYKIKLFNSRSFRSTARLISGHIAPEKGANLFNPINLLRKGLAFITHYLLVPLLYFAGWNLAADKAFKKIPVEDRDFVVVRSKKNDDGKHVNRDDPLVPHHFSSMYSLVKEMQQKVEDKPKPLNRQDQLLLEDNLKKHKFHVGKERGNPRKTNGHTCNRRYLLPRDNTPQNAREYTVNFFKHVWPQSMKKEHIKETASLIPS
jgi:hypothetical protein